MSPSGHARCSILLGALLLPVCTTTHAQPWSMLGPAPIMPSGDAGRVSAVACHPTLPDRYFVGAADGGVWRTDDGGASWTPLTDHLPTTSIGAVALDPTNPDTIYAGTGEANFANHSRYGLGLYKSIDGGATWQHLAQSVFAGRCFSRIVVHPTLPGVLFAGVTRAGGFPELAAAKGHPAASGPVGVFRSGDGGVSWTHLTSGIPGNLSATDVALDPVNPARLYAGIGHIFGDPANGVYASLDGGATWTRRAGGLPQTGVGRITLVVAPSNPDRVLAIITNAADASGGGAGLLGVYLSQDAGVTWMNVNTGLSQATYGWYLSTASFLPGNAGTYILGGLNLRRTTNDGIAFQTITPPHVDMHALAWDAAGRLVAGDDGGVHRSSNLGNTWQARNAGLGTVQFYAGLSTHPAIPAGVWGGTQDNGSNLRTVDGLVWNRRLGGDGGWTQWDASNHARLFAEFQGTGNLYASTDGGVVFNQSAAGIVSADRNCFLPPFLIDPVNPGTMYYATHRVYRSSDGGANWAPISQDLTLGTGAIRALAISPIDPRRLYAATNDGRVLASADAGSTFAPVLSGVHGWPRVTRELWCDTADARTVYLAGAVFGGAHVRRSRDGGATWQTLDGDLPDSPVNVVVADPRCTPPVLYAGTDAGVYRSFDDGVSWRIFGEGLPRACVIDLLLEPARNRIVAGTQGRGAWAVQIPILPQGGPRCGAECDGIDFNNDGVSPDSGDIEDFLSVFAGGPCSNDPPQGPGCHDIDFNNDNVSPDSGDIESFLEVFGGGSCW